MYIARFLLFVYLKWIKEDFDILNIWGKIVIYPAWFIRSILVWILSFVCFPIIAFYMYIEERGIVDEIKMEIDKFLLSPSEYLKKQN